MTQIHLRKCVGFEFWLDVPFGDVGINVGILWDLNRECSVHCFPLNKENLVKRTVLRFEGLGLLTTLNPEP